MIVFLKIIAFILNLIGFLIVARWYYWTKSDEPLSWLLVTSAGLLSQVGYYIARLKNYIANSNILNSISEKVFMIKKRHYDFRPVEATEINALYQDFQTLFGADLMNLNELKKIFSKNPKTIWVIHEFQNSNQRSQGSKIGFFEFFPINKRTLNNLKEGTKDGRILTESDIISLSSSTNNYYIGGVGLLATNSRTKSLLKGIVLSSFLKYIEILNQEKKLNLYTRPVTQDGLRLVQKYRFVKLHRNKSDTESIWELQLKKNESTAFI